MRVGVLPPLTETIEQLPDNPLELKALLSKVHYALQKTQEQLKESQRRVHQFQSLYEALDAENDRLRES